MFVTYFLVLVLGVSPLNAVFLQETKSEGDCTSLAKVLSEKSPDKSFGCIPIAHDGV